MIKRSRDAKDTRNVKKNFGAKTDYLKSVFRSNSSKHPDDAEETRRIGS